MLCDLQTILKGAEKEGFAVPAFNVYNMETVMGVVQAAEELRSPVIMQFYSRLATTGVADYLAPVILRAAGKTDIPVCMHLDHGANFEAAAIAVRNGATGIMVDFSTLPLKENIEKTAKTAQFLKPLGIGVEGELGHIGVAANGDESVSAEYTDPDEAKEYLEKTGVAALAVMVGTAHGRYKRLPVLDIERIRAIRKKTGVPVVLHGGSGVPDEQIRLAVQAGVRKMNFSTDLCLAFLDACRARDASIVGIDTFMQEPIRAVEEFVKSKIRVLGAEGRA